MSSIPIFTAEFTADAANYDLMKLPVLVEWLAKHGYKGGFVGHVTILTNAKASVNVNGEGLMPLINGKVYDSMERKPFSSILIGQAGVSGTIIINL